MMGPAIVLTFIFCYIPMYGVTIAFQQYNLAKGFWNSAFIGLHWFDVLFKTPDVWELVVNTLIISTGKIIAGQLAAIIFALLLNEVLCRLFKRAVQTVVYIPYFLSWVIMGGVIGDLLSTKGVINQLLQFAGINPIFFLGSNSWFRWTLILTDTWKSYGWNAIIYLAALTAVSHELYDACNIDGGGRIRQTIHVTLPAISSTIVLLAVLNLGGMLNAGFEQVLVLYNPAVYDTGDIIDTFVYRMGLEQMQFSFATAVGLLKSVVGSVLIVVSYWLADRFAGYRIF
ncbi:MAG: protein lplB [Clostridiales bacterium GWC2_40_7]|nr:MAG: protein lplB [Clostridiales bacterium GWC2_40_7]